MATLQNMPEVKIGIVGVSRDCFPASLTSKRMDALFTELKKKKLTDVVRCSVIIENEIDAMSALAEMDDQAVDAVVVYLGNFGPEGPTTIFAERFGGPVMVMAAAEENKAVLSSDRGDALCGLLNVSYNLNLRSLPAYIPQYPVGGAKEVVEEIQEFLKIARVIIGMTNLKVFGFGPRPADFMACNAPIAPLYDLGIEVVENSELDMLEYFKSVKGQKKAIEAIAQDMAKELGTKGNPYPELLPKLAQFELALTKFMEENMGASEYAVFANKCWPAFEGAFGFVPCYINSRLAGRGIPVACEVDLYGAVSEYMVQCATELPATLLDINNSVPKDILPKSKAALKGAAFEDLFMGFHCGNTCSSCLKKGTCGMKYQLIMNRLMEEGKEPNITRGTLEGQLLPGETTMFRLQSTPDCKIRSYIADGHILDINPQSFGSIGVFGIPGFARFYRHILVGQNFPHHGAIAFKKCGKTMYEVLKYLGIDSIGVPLPDGVRYEDENPFLVY